MSSGVSIKLQLDGRGTSNANLKKAQMRTVHAGAKDPPKYPMRIYVII